MDVCLGICLKKNITNQHISKWAESLHAQLTPLVCEEGVFQSFVNHRVHFLQTLKKEEWKRVAGSAAGTCLRAAETRQFDQVKEERCENLGIYRPCEKSSYPMIYMSVFPSPTFNPSRAVMSSGGSAEPTFQVMMWMLMEEEKNKNIYVFADLVSHPYLCLNSLFPQNNLLKYLL